MNNTDLLQKADDYRRYALKISNAHYVMAGASEVAPQSFRYSCHCDEHHRLIYAMSPKLRHSP